MNHTHGHEIPAEGLKGLVQNWRADLLAAVSVSLVALPLALGVAVASGVAPISGLISAIIGGDQWSCSRTYSGDSLSTYELRRWQWQCI